MKNICLPKPCFRKTAILVGALLAAAGASAAISTINFDDAPDGTMINTRYPGVTFNNPIGGNVFAKYGLGGAPSAPNVVCVTNGGVFPFFDSRSGAVDAHFSTPRRSISIDVRPVSGIDYNFQTPTRRPYLQAFDSAGNYLGQTVYYQGTLPTGCCYSTGAVETLTIVVPAGNIGIARFSSQQPGTNDPGAPPIYGMFDNLRSDDGHYSLTVNIVGGGYVLVSPFGPYSYGDSPVVTASPFTDWAFSAWSGDINSTLNPILPIMWSDIVMTATFVTTPQSGPNFVVTTTADHDDGVAGITDCTLREAVNAANANSDPSTITFATNVTGVITLQQGHLNISQNTTIKGPGAQVLAISGNNSSRIFNVLGGNVVISDLCITNGRVTGLAGTPGQIGGGTGGSGGGAYGGAIYNQATLVLSNCWIVGNAAQGGTGGVGGEDDANTPGGIGGVGGLGSGGGIYNNFNSLTMINCTVSGNSTVGGLGGSGFDAYDNYFLTGGAGGAGGPGAGGGLCNNGLLNLTNCTLSGNFCAGGGGGRGGNGFPDDPGGMGGAGGNGTGGGLASLNTLNLSSCTLSLNSLSAGGGGPGGTGRPGTAPSGVPGTRHGGGLQSTTSANVIQNTLIAGNIGSTAPDCSGTCTSLGYNLIGIIDGATGFASATDQAGTGGSPLNALLGPLQYRGGPAPALPLLPGSPAVDKGKSAGLLTDERGAPRPFDFPSVANAAGGDGSDIGAFELSGPPVKMTRVGPASVVLSWPAYEPGFSLQSATQLTSSTVWTPVPGTPVIVGNEYRVTNTMTTRLFYRLKSP